MPASIRKRDLIETIKLVGRQHSFLTGIVDQLNFCYSFQVLNVVFKLSSPKDFSLNLIHVSLLSY